jgi:hypothetical protein
MPINGTVTLRLDDTASGTAAGLCQQQRSVFSAARTLTAKRVFKLLLFLTPEAGRAHLQPSCMSGLEQPTSMCEDLHHVMCVQSNHRSADWRAGGTAVLR